MQSPSILPLLAFITGVYFAAGFSEHRDPRLVHVKRMGSCGGLSSGQFLVSVLVFPCVRWWHLLFSICSFFSSLPPQLVVLSPILWDNIFDTLSFPGGTPLSTETIFWKEVKQKLPADFQEMDPFPVQPGKGAVVW